MSDLPQTDQLTYEGDLRRVVREEIQTQLKTLPSRDEVRRMILDERERIEERSRAAMDEQMTSLRSDFRGELADMRAMLREFAPTKEMVNTLNTSIQSVQTSVANIQGRLDGWDKAIEARDDQVKANVTRIGRNEEEIRALDNWHDDVDQRFSLMTNFIYGSDDQPGLSHGIKQLQDQVNPLAEWINREKEMREARRKFVAGLGKTIKSAVTSNPGITAALIAGGTAGGVGLIQIIEFILSFSGG